MLLKNFLSVANSHPNWVAYALADGIPVKIMGGSHATLEGKLPKKIQGRVQLELCMEPNDAMPDDMPNGSVLLQAQVTPLARNKSGWRCEFQILDAEDVLDRRRAPRMQVHRMKLVGRFEGESTWVFPVAVRDVGPEGLGIETHEPLEKGDALLLTGFEEFFPNNTGPWQFEVRATFGKRFAGLQLLPGQDDHAQCLRELHSDLAVVSRFWRSLVGHARHQKGLEPGNELRVSIDFSIKQLRQRRAAQLSLVSDPELEALFKSLKDEAELVHIKQELAALQSTKKTLASTRTDRLRVLDRFLNQLQPGVAQSKRAQGKK